MGKYIRKFDPKHVVDIGANIGQWGRTFISYYPNSSIYSFEPSKKTFRVLRKNTESFNNWHNFNFAVGNPKDNILYLSQYGSAEHSLVKTNSSQGKMKIKTTILDANLVPKNIDLLKIDVEGYELEVIKYITNLQIKYLFIEVDLQDLDRNLKEIQEVIKGHWKNGSSVIGVQKLWSGSPKGNALIQINTIR